MDSPQTNSQTHAIGPDTLALTGQVETGGLRFESRVRVVNTGGQVKTNGNVITVENADAATVVSAAATSFKNFQDISGNPAQRCAEVMANVADNNLRRFARGAAGGLSKFVSAREFESWPHCARGFADG